MTLMAHWSHKRAYQAAICGASGLENKQQQLSMKLQCRWYLSGCELVGWADVALLSQTLHLNFMKPHMKLFLSERMQVTMPMHRPDTSCRPLLYSIQLPFL